MSELLNVILIVALSGTTILWLSERRAHRFTRRSRVWWMEEAKKLWVARS